MLDQEKCRRNIQKMAAKADQNNVKLRPHFKTHQSGQVGEWFREAGIDRITVSSLRMAEYFASYGWTDIMVAFPANILEMERINRLAATIKLHLVAVNLETIEALAQGLQHPVYTWLKIDTGYHRTGILPTNHGHISLALESIKQSVNLYFSGFLAHDGHTYKQTEKAAVQAIHNTTVSALQELRTKYKPHFPDLKLSLGDTPSCSMLDDLTGVDEIRPGNYVFYDLTQQYIGSCSFDEIAVCMACPVVAIHPERNEIILYGGSVHFSKDVLQQEDGSSCFGRIVELTESGWTAPKEGIMLVSLSQEHGIVKASDAELEKYKIGDLLYVLPVHSCLTADAMRGYTTLEGEQLEHLSGLLK